MKKLFFRKPPPVLLCAIVFALLVSPVGSSAQEEDYEKSPQPRVEPVPHEVVAADPKAGLVYFDRVSRRANEGARAFRREAGKRGYRHNALTLERALCALEEKASLLRTTSRQSWNHEQLARQVRVLIPLASSAGRLMETIDLPPELKDDIADVLDYAYALNAYFLGGKK